jgi:hypothetical protein
MTTFTQPVYIGQNTGAPSTDTRGFVQVIKEVAGVSAGSRSVTAPTLPDNSTVTMIQGVVTSAVAGIAAAVTLRAGTAASPTRYGSISVSAEGVYTIPLTKYVLIDNPSAIVLEVTAQASAADLTAVKVSPRIIYGSRS